MKEVITKKMLANFVDRVAYGTEEAWDDLKEEAINLTEQLPKQWICSFCGKNDSVVGKMIVNNSTEVAICDECIDLAHSIIREEA